MWIKLINLKRNLSNNPHWHEPYNNHQYGVRSFHSIHRQFTILFHILTVLWFYVFLELLRWFEHFAELIIIGVSIWWRGILWIEWRLERILCLIWILSVCFTIILTAWLLTGLLTISISMLCIIKLILLLISCLCEILLIILFSLIHIFENIICLIYLFKSFCVLLVLLMSIRVKLFC